MKKFKINLLPIIGMMVAVATFAFTTIEKNAEPEDGWYEVVQIDPNASQPELPSNLKITSFEGSSLPPGDCQPENLVAEPCSVKLDLSNFSAADIIDMTVADAISTHNAEIDNSESSDGYARVPEL